MAKSNQEYRKSNFNMTKVKGLLRTRFKKMGFYPFLHCFKSIYSTSIANLKGEK